MARQRLKSKNKFVRSSNTQFKRTGTADFFSYTLVTGGNFYGLKVGDAIGDFLDFDQRTSSTPEVVITGNTAVIDFGSSQINKDLNYIKAISDTLTSGNTFTITNGEYYDPNTEEYADISGTYTFEGIFRDTLIKATFDTLANIPSGVVRYSSEYFADVPQINLLGTANNGREQFAIKNYLGTESLPSFTSMDLRVDDYVTISNSTLNSNAFKVEDFYLDPNGTEVVILGNTAASDENRIGITSEINLYRDQGHSRNDTSSNTYVNIQTLKITVGQENDDYYFMINGVRDPQITLQRGITYIFDCTDPSNYRGNNNRGYPFRLSNIRDGLFTPSRSRRGQSVFILDGVSFPRTEANMFIFEPRFIKNSVIYYFSESKRNMGGELKIDGTYSIYDQRIAGPSSIPPQYTVSYPEYDAQAIVTANQVSFMNEEFTLVNPTNVNDDPRSRSTRNPLDGSAGGY
tara:strand:+ start:11826 stop:13205 length:1380 start_codon:yes stop_codon:yes gene_type:complete